MLLFGGALLPSHLFLCKHHCPLNIVLIVVPFQIATGHLYPRLWG